VIVGTVASITSHLSLVGMKPFSLCIIDEASQILEPYLLPMISLCLQNGMPCIGKFVMIGDHKQLPAVVQQRPSESVVSDSLLRDISLLDCRDSLFERMLRLYRNDKNVCFMLTRQGRMHHEIADFPNKHFYQGQLQVVPLHHQLTPSTEPRVRFVHVSPYANGLWDNVNVAEAELVVDYLINIWEANKADFHPDETVGVIVPYRNQISAILSILASRLQVDDHPLMNITIDTVERFQGSQRKYIIYSLTVQREYQLRFLTETNFIEDGQLIDRKLNVAMTRAQEYLIMIGNRVVLSKNPLYAQLIQDYLCE
jgi:superfamily I DNA and/or RNA helicase